MNDDFTSLFDYNRWANALMLDACRKLSPEQYAAEPVPGWTSVRSTVVHIAVATDGWLRALAGVRVEETPTETDLPTVEDGAKLLDLADQNLTRALPTFTPEWLATPKTLVGRGRTVVVHPWVVLRHLVNHATYHRGQIAAKLKRLGVEPPQTDLIFWYFGNAAPPQ